MRQEHAKSMVRGFLTAEFRRPLTHCANPCEKLFAVDFIRAISPGDAPQGVEEPIAALSAVLDVLAVTQLQFWRILTVVASLVDPRHGLNKQLRVFLDVALEMQDAAWLTRSPLSCQGIDVGKLQLRHLLARKLATLVQACKRPI